MRFEEGINLAALLDRRGTLPEDELLRILLPILDGLELVHDAGFIHRDIKPDNIHIGDDGRPVLLDFGSARQALGNCAHAHDPRGAGLRAVRAVLQRLRQPGAVDRHLRARRDLLSRDRRPFAARRGLAQQGHPRQHAGRPGAGDGHRGGPVFGPPARRDRSRAGVRGEGPAADDRGVAAGARRRACGPDAAPAVAAPAPCAPGNAPSLARRRRPAAAGSAACAQARKPAPPRRPFPGAAGRPSERADRLHPRRAIAVVLGAGDRWRSASPRMSSSRSGRDEARSKIAALEKQIQDKDLADAAASARGQQQKQDEEARQRREQEQQARRAGEEAGRGRRQAQRWRTQRRRARRRRESARRRQEASR